MTGGGRRIVVVVAAAVGALATVALLSLGGDGDDPPARPAEPAAAREPLYTGTGVLRDDDLPRTVVAGRPPALVAPTVLPSDLRPASVRLPAPGGSSLPDRRRPAPLARVLYGDPDAADPLTAPYLIIDRFPVPDCCGSSLPAEGEEGVRAIELSDRRDGLSRERADVAQVWFQERNADTLVTGHLLAPEAVARAAAAASDPEKPPQIPLDGLPPGLEPLAAVDSSLLEQAGSVSFADAAGRRELSITSVAFTPEVELRVRLSRHVAPGFADGPPQDHHSVVRRVGDVLAIVSGLRLTDDEVAAAAASGVARPPGEWPQLESAVMEAPPEFLLPECAGSPMILSGTIPSPLVPAPVEWAAGASDAGVACAGLITPVGRLVGLDCRTARSDGLGVFLWGAACGFAPPGTARVRVEDGYGHAVEAALGGTDPSRRRPYFVVLSPPARAPGPVIRFYGPNGEVIDEVLPPGVGAGACPWTPHEEPCRVPDGVRTQP